MLNSLYNSLRSEWTKLRSTRSFYWTTALFLILALGWPYLMVTMIADLTGAELLAQEPMMLFTPIQMLAMPVLAIQGIMIVTTEYRYKAQMNTYLATNKRWQAALVKACMYAAIAALLVFIACIVVLWMAGSLGNDNDLVQRILWVFPLGMALLVFFGQGLGLLLRQTAGVVALTLILYLGLGNLVMFIPKIGEDLVNYMPFTALNNFLLNTPSASAPWEGVAGFGWIFTAWSLGLWFLGVIALEKRDV